MVAMIHLSLLDWRGLQIVTSFMEELSNATLPYSTNIIIIIIMSCRCHEN